MQIKTIETKNGSTLQFPVLEEADFTSLPVKVMDLVMDLEENPENPILAYKLVRILINTFLPKAESVKWDNLTFEEFSTYLTQGSEVADLPKD